MTDIMTIISGSISEQDLAVMIIFFIKFCLIYICCFLGTFIKDTLYANKNKLKIDIKSIIAYNIPCAFIISAACDICVHIKIKLSGWACISFISGMWSREILSILCNSKTFAIFTKLITRKAINTIGSELSDKEQEKLATAFQNAVKNATENSTVTSEPIVEADDELSQDPIGEFNWISILEY